MNSRFVFCLRFSGITVRFVLPTPIVLPEDFAPFRCEDSAAADQEYTVQLLTEPLRPEGDLVCHHREADIYRTDKGWLHIHGVLGDEAGCQVACLFCSDGHHTLYYPASRWAYYSEVWHCTHLICGERLLLRHDAMLLHSSLVHYHGKAILFSGPSGAGKSTQARLWEEYAGAEVINGDRTVIMRRGDSFYGGGSMWSGTSGIYRPEQAPIAGIFLVEQAPENRLERLGFQAFVPLFSQTIVNSWDSQFMSQITQLYAQLLAQIPVYRLYCRPDKDAVTLCLKTLFSD